MIGFLRENARWLGAGFALTFASAFGQTWFIALFAGEIREVHGLSNGQWGALYTVATLASAALLYVRGALADTVPMERLAPAVTLAFAASALLLAFAPGLVALGVALFGLRFCGQGMFGHIAMTAMGRWFRAQRGRAVSIAMLGQSVGEAVLPLPTILIAGALGWRGAWIAAALLLALGLAPLLAGLLRRGRLPRSQGETGAEVPGLAGRHWTRSEAFRHWLLPALVPMMLTPGFIGTVVYFHQVNISGVKGWPLTAMAAGYPVYAALTVAAAFAAGWLADRVGPAALLPLSLVPMGVGILAIGAGSEVWAWILGLGLLGVTAGITGALWGTLLPAVFGSRHLGAIRAFVTTLMVVSTAAGPGITGYLIDAGHPFPEQCLPMGLWCLGLSLAMLTVSRRIGREMTS